MLTGYSKRVVTPSRRPQPPIEQPPYPLREATEEEIRREQAEQAKRGGR